LERLKVTHVGGKTLKLGGCGWGRNQQINFEVTGALLQQQKVSRKAGRMRVHVRRKNLKNEKRDAATNNLKARALTRGGYGRTKGI